MAVKTAQFSDAYWEARFAPFLLAGAVAGLVLSLVWVRAPLRYLIIAVFSGALRCLFYVLHQRTGRGAFHAVGMVCGFVPLFVVLRYLNFAESFQYTATFAASYALPVALFRNQILNGLKQDAETLRQG